MAVQRVDGVEVFAVDGNTGGPYLVVMQGDAATCTCPATTTCHHVREVIEQRADPLAQLAGLQRDRELQDRREEALVGRARQQGASWHTVGVALGRTSEGVRKRYGRGDLGQQIADAVTA